MLEGFRVPVSQHLGGLGYPNVGVSSVRRQRWRRRQELTNIWIVRVAVLGFPWNLGWRNQYRVQITATKCPRFPLQFKSPKSSASYPGSTLGSSAIYNPWSQVNVCSVIYRCWSWSWLEKRMDLSPLHVEQLGIPVGPVKSLPLTWLQPLRDLPTNTPARSISFWWALWA